MKPIQQRCLFQVAAKSEVKAMIESQRTLQESRFQPWGWIAGAFAALLLISCRSSKPENPGQPTNNVWVDRLPASEFTNHVGIYRVEKRESDGTNWIQINGFTSGPGVFRVRRVR